VALACTRRSQMVRWTEVQSSKTSAMREVSWGGGDDNLRGVVHDGFLKI
jgi:hypothetical protein